MAQSKKVLISPMERLREKHNMGPADIYVFETLRRSPGRPMSINEISAASGLKRATVYFSQVRLLKRGLLARNEKWPRRPRACRFYYRLSQEGKAAIKQARLPAR